MFIKQVLLSLVCTNKKLVCCILAGFLVTANAMPASILEVRALFVSLDVIERMPVVLKTLNISELNDLVLNGFLKDDDFSGVPAKGKKAGKINTKTDFLTPAYIKDFKPVLNRISLITDNSSSFSGYKHLFIVANGGGGGIEKLCSRTDVTFDGLMQWMSPAVLARGSIDDVVFNAGYIIKM